MTSRRVVTVSVSILAALYAAAFLVCVAARLTFGFELAWLESGMQAMTARLAAHQSMYVAPSPSYVPFIYPPLYYVAAHGIERLAPALAGAPALRLVSLASTLATLAVLWRCLARGGASPRLRLVLGALYLSFYGRFEYWHDTSRVDSLFVLLFFASAALLVEGTSLRSALGAGALGGLAILTKQPAVPLLLGCGAVVLYTTRKQARVLAALGVACASATAGLAAMGELGNQWLYYYVVQVPATHPLMARNLGKGVAFVVGTMPLFLLAAALSLRARTRARVEPTTPIPLSDDKPWRWTLVFAVSTMIMLALRLKQGASLNFFLPIVPLGIVVAAPALARLGARRAEPLLLGQLLIVVYNPLASIPTAQDWRAGFDLLGAARRAGRCLPAAVPVVSGAGGQGSGGARRGGVRPGGVATGPDAGDRRSARRRTLRRRHLLARRTGPGTLPPRPVAAALPQRGPAADGRRVLLQRSSHEAGWRLPLRRPRRG